MQCAGRPLPVDSGDDIDNRASSQCTQEAQEEVDYRIAMSKQEMCVQGRDVIFSMNIVTSTPLHSSYIHFDADKRRRFIKCHYVDCDRNGCSKSARIEPAPVVEGDERFPAQCSDKCHHGELVC